MNKNANKLGDIKVEVVYLIILVLIGIIVNFMYLGDLMLWDTDEDLYTEIAREMFITGDYITTQWNFNPWFCHPPLYFWLTVITSKFWGWTEFSARFPSAFFSLLTVVLIYFLGKLLFNKKIGFYSGLVFVLTMQVWLQARMALLDTPFIFFIVLAVYFYYRAFKSSNYRWFIGFWISAGFTVISKGPVGVILLFIYIFLHLFVEKKWKEILLPLIFSPGILIFLLVAVPWFGVMSDIYGYSFNKKVFGYFFLNRIFEPVMEQGGKWYYYFPYLLAGFIPWTSFLPMTFYVFMKERRDKNIRVLAYWIICTFLIFTFSATKRPNYILFIYPYLSIAVGFVVYKAINFKEYIKLNRMTYFFLSFSIIIMALAFRCLALFFYPDYWMKYSSYLSFLLVFIFLGVFIVLFLAMRGDNKKTFYGIIISMVALYVLILSCTPILDSIRPENNLIRDLYRLKRSDDKLLLGRNFGHRYSFLFYTRMPIEVFKYNSNLVKRINHGKSMFVVMYKEDFNEYRKDIKVPYTIIRKEGNSILFYIDSSIIEKNKKKAYM